MFSNLLRSVPGYRSHVIWKQIVASVGYFALLLNALGSAISLLVSLETVLIVWLAADAWGLRSRIPALSTGNFVHKALAWAGILFVAVVSLAVVTGANSQPKSVPSEVAAVVPTTTPGTSTEPPAPTALPPTPVPPSPTTPPSPSFIQGLTRVDVTINLERRGFQCSGQQFMRNRVAWVCRSAALDGSYEFTVDIQGASSTQIDFVNAIALNYGSRPTEQVAVDFLGYIASVPYEGSRPAEARQWLIQNIAAGGEMTIGTAHFRLFGSGRNRNLQITSLGYAQ